MLFENTGITKKYFKDIQFLIKGTLQGDDTRLFMQCIKIETIGDTTYFCALEGRVLHIVHYKLNDKPDLNDGMYQIKTNSKDAILLEKTENHGTFPNWRKYYDLFNYVKVIEDFHLSDDKKSYSFTNLIFILNNLGYQIQHKYLQSLQFLNIKWDIYIDPVKHLEPIRLVSTNKLAVIMPMELKDCLFIYNNAYAKIETTLKELNKRTELFDLPVIQKKKYLWE